MSDVVPAAIALLPPDLRARLRVTQQARAEDIDEVRAAYAARGVEAELSPFFSDLPAHMALAHLVIARAGASTVAELAVIGRPSILVPLPHALDNDQLANANALAMAGGAVVTAQDRFTPQSARRRSEGQAVRSGGACGLGRGRQARRARPTPPSRLADVVLATAGRRTAR